MFAIIGFILVLILVGAMLYIGWGLFRMGAFWGDKTAIGVGAALLAIGLAIGWAAIAYAPFSVTFRMLGV